MKKFLTFFTKKVVYIPLIIILVLVGGIMAWSAFKPKNYQTAIAERIDLSQEVSVTGKVVAAEDVNMGFESGGKVSSVNSSVGTKVRKGQLLASVASGDLYAVVLDRQARLQAEKAKLTSLLQGTRSEELQITETSKEQAEIALKDEIIDAYVTSDNVVKTYADQFFNSPETNAPKVINYSDYDEKTELEDTRVEIRYMLRDWQDANSQMQISGFKEEYLSSAKSNLASLRDFLNDLTSVVSAYEKDGTLTDSELSAYRSAISSARSSVGAAITSLNTSEKTYRSASDQLALDEAGADSIDIQIQEASVKSAEASLIQAQAALSKTSIYAPFDGTVTKIDLRVGELVSGGSPVVSMISSANFEIESFIPEADIAKVKVGDRASTTLDAYGDDVVFETVVTGIDLSETEVEGISTYKTTLQFSQPDERIRSGMTANLDIAVEGKFGVIAVPQAALVTKAGKRSVTVLNSKGKEEVREVRTGSVDSTGKIEIISGVEEGETVIVNSK